MKSVTFLSAILAAIVLTLGLGSGPAWTANPHFIKADDDLKGFNLICSWKEAGLGDNQNISYRCSADANALYACQNNGKNFPSDPKKQEETGNVFSDGTFSSGKNGQITASLTVMPPDTTLECPPGQKEVLCYVEYTNVVLEDLTNGLSESLDPLSRENANCADIL